MMTPDQPTGRLTRRNILAAALNLSWIAPLLIALGEAVRFLRYEPPGSEPPLIALGRPQTFPVYMEIGRVWLMRDPGGLYALDAVCTHLGCIVGSRTVGAAFECPCHGSRFDANGAVVQGPATQPLRHLELSRAADNQLVVDRTKTVDAGVRLSPD